MTIINPFEDDERSYIVLVNDEEQYSLWPTFADVPAGWNVALTSSTRAICLAFIEANWTDMRPRSIRDDISDGASGVA